MSRVTVDGEEWVQGTKLTGDQNVPAGKVTFRAKVGKAARLPPSAAYPPEFGVRQRYKGQGRVARDGYSNAKWVECSSAACGAVRSAAQLCERATPLPRPRAAGDCLLCRALGS